MLKCFCVLKAEEGGSPAAGTDGVSLWVSSQTEMAVGFLSNYGIEWKLEAQLKQPHSWTGFALKAAV